MLDVEDIRLRAVPAKSDSKESQEVYEKEIQRLVMEKIAFSDALAASGKTLCHLYRKTISVRLVSYKVH